MNNKGFTLVEVLAVVAIIAIIGIIAVPNVMSALNESKNKSDEIMYENIKVALQTMYEEIDYSGNSFYEYNNNGVTGINISKSDIDGDGKLDEVIETNIQTLVGNGFLTGINNEEECVGSGSSCLNKNSKILLNANNKDIGECKVKIIKKIGNNYKVLYEVEEKNEGCIFKGE